LSWLGEEAGASEGARFVSLASFSKSSPSSVLNVPKKLSAAALTVSDVITAVALEGADGIVTSRSVEDAVGYRPPR
jgi:hypothetical protein